jgi:hypothetical protein
MQHLRCTSKTLFEKIRESMVILSEREANRILLSQDNITRNLFVSKEKPKETLKNLKWYKFLIDQLKRRTYIKHRLYHAIPGLFPDLDQKLRMKLATFMFNEIKRKRKMDISMKKSPKNNNISLTGFQELVFYHSKGKLSSRYPKLIETGEPKWNAAEVYDNDELEIFKTLRTYKTSEDTIPKEPKTPVLTFIYIFERFLDCHCQTVAESIASK